MASNDLQPFTTIWNERRAFIYRWGSQHRLNLYSLNLGYKIKVTFHPHYLETKSKYNENMFYKLETLIKEDDPTKNGVDLLSKKRVMWRP